MRICSDTWREIGSWEPGPAATERLRVEQFSGYQPGAWLTVCQLLPTRSSWLLLYLASAALRIICSWLLLRPGSVAFSLVTLLFNCLKGFDLLPSRLGCPHCTRMITPGLLASLWKTSLKPVLVQGPGSCGQSSRTMQTQWEGAPLWAPGGACQCWETTRAGLQGSQKIFVANCRYFEERQAWDSVDSGAYWPCECRENFWYFQGWVSSSVK